MDSELINQEEQYGQAPEQAAPVVEQEEAPANPTDLAEAFAMLRENDRTAAQTSVADDESGQSQGADRGGIQGTQQGAGEQPDISEQLSNTSGGAAVDLSGFDALSQAKQAYADLRSLVVEAKRKEWADKGYKKFTVRDLARRDEQTGRIIYVNPNDRPEDWERPGYQGLTIEQAKTWCDVTNDDLNDQWKKECSELEKEYVQKARPYFELLAYADTYSKLNPVEQYYVDTITDSYAMRNAQGQVMGFSCDLNKVTQIAKQLAANAPQMQQQSQPVNNVRQPATDARSSAGTSKGGTPRINDLNDAFQYLWEKERQEGR